LKLHRNVRADRHCCKGEGASRQNIVALSRGCEHRLQRVSSRRRHSLRRNTRCWRWALARHPPRVSGLQPVASVGSAAAAPAAAPFRVRPQRQQPRGASPPLAATRGRGAGRSPPSSRRRIRAAEVEVGMGRLGRVRSMESRRRSSSSLSCCQRVGSGR
jgi:hypothetical protein